MEDYLMSANSSVGKKILNTHGINKPRNVYYNLAIPALYEEFVKRGEGIIGEGGTVVAHTGKHTGRSPQDRFIVKDSKNKKTINWGNVNKAFEPKKFDALLKRVLNHLNGKALFVRDLFVCAHKDYKLSVRVINEYAWHNIFVNSLFLRPGADEVPHKKVDITVICAPSFKANPKRDGTRTETFIILNLTKRIALIGGTEYAGEMKKSVFSALNYLLPEKNVFPMHCSANVGKKGDVSLFFGLSGTGKTTLSADPERPLIGDDEHGWFNNGVFNFEGGCYAKAIKLNPKTELEIYNASLKFGSVIENGDVDFDTRKIDFDSAKYTENTRVAYPIHHLEKIVPNGVGGIPKTIFMLTYDAFGVLPPISKLSVQQALYYFVIGYTAKVAGTERGVTEPQVTFSSCFGAPFLPRPPKFYAGMLKDKLKKHRVDVWLLNTGITGGPYGVGKRMPLPETRALVTAAINGSLNKVKFTEVPIFGLKVPSSCRGVRKSVLQPRLSWKSSKQYDEKARKLKDMFEEEFKKHSI
jgi:phosphoenolpyruvate carboxykinase (ATP)